MMMPRDQVNVDEGGEDVVRLHDVLDGSWMLRIVMCLKSLTHFVTEKLFPFPMERIMMVPSEHEY
jgi:hypothetical protein